MNTDQIRQQALQKLLTAACRLAGLPAPKIVDDGAGGCEVEFRRAELFADLDVFEDGDIIASTGGRGCCERSWRIKHSELEATLLVFREHLG